MIAKLAQFSAFVRVGGRLSARVAAADNDNRPVRRFAGPARTRRRPILVRRWHIAPAGTLECSWHVQDSAVCTGDEPGISRHIGLGKIAISNLPRAALISVDRIAAVLRYDGMSGGRLAAVTQLS